MGKAPVFYVIAALLLMLAGCAASGPHARGDYFPPTEDETAAVNGVLARADAAGRLALIVVGANWCHDSAALAETLKAEQVAASLAGYETLLLDAGEWVHGEDTVQRFGVPVIAHTPTVLIVEPGTGRLVNWDDHHLFRESAMMEPKEVAAYFRRNADPATWQVRPDTSSGRGAALDDWAADQGDRIRAGYAHLKALGFNTPAFRDAWGDLRGLRYEFSEDYPALLMALADGDAFDLPAYPPLPWE